MKKIVTMLFLMVAMFAFHVPKATAQSSPAFFTGTTTNPAVAGEVPVLNATVDTLLLTLSGNTNILVKVSARLLKTSGTIAGTIRLYGSTYGTTSTWHAIGDTATNTNASVNEHTWNLTGNDLGWKYLRILQDGGTTMAGTISAKAQGIKQNN